MDIAIAQANSHLGNIAENTKAAVIYCNKAYESGSDIICFPELYLIGYSPNDLLERPELIKEQNKYLQQFIKSIPKNITVLMGCVESKNKKIYNSCALIQKNKIVKYFSKELLPNYDVFDESRHFSSGSLKKGFFKHKGKNVLVCICEDLWFSESTKYLKNPLKSLNKKT